MPEGLAIINEQCDVIFCNKSLKKILQSQDVDLTLRHLKNN